MNKIIVDPLDLSSTSARSPLRRRVEGGRPAAEQRSNYHGVAGVDDRERSGDRSAGSHGATYSKVDEGRTSILLQAALL